MEQVHASTALACSQWLPSSPVCPSTSWSCLKAAAGTSSWPKVQGPCVPAHWFPKQAAALIGGAPSPPATHIPSQGGMLGDCRDPPGSLERAWGGHGPHPGGRQGCAPSHLCVLAPLLFLLCLLPVSPLNSLINISPRTGLCKLTLLLHRLLQGRGARVQAGLPAGAGGHGEPIATAWPPAATPVWSPAHCAALG